MRCLTVKLALHFKMLALATNRNIKGLSVGTEIALFEV
jgi:hypothetical protein